MRHPAGTPARVPVYRMRSVNPVRVHFRSIQYSRMVGLRGMAQPLTVTDPQTLPFESRGTGGMPVCSIQSAILRRIRAISLAGSSSKAELPVLITMVSVSMVSCPGR